MSAAQQGLIPGLMRLTPQQKRLLAVRTASRSHASCRNALSRSTPPCLFVGHTTPACFPKTAGRHGASLTAACLALPAPQVVLIGGGVAGARTLQAAVASAQREQRSMTKNLPSTKSRQKIAVDALFASRLLTILKM